MKQNDLNYAIQECLNRNDIFETGPVVRILVKQRGLL